MMALPLKLVDHALDKPSVCRDGARRRRLLGRALCDTPCISSVIH